MTQTRAERLAYARGYNRGRVRERDWAMKLLDLLKGYRARLADLDTARACATCRFWTRGSGSARWGRCAKAGDTTAWLVEPGAWPEREPNWQTAGLCIITHEHFGCVNWLAPAKARA